MKQYIFEVIGQPRHGMTQALNYVQSADSENEAYRLVRERAISDGFVPKFTVCVSPTRLSHSRAASPAA